MKTKLAFFIVFGIFVSFFLFQSINFSSAELNANECNVCHGSGHKGHISYAITLGISETILNGTTNALSATIVNKDFPLSQSSITLVESAEYSFVPLNSSDSLTKNLGTVGRGSTNVITWQIKPNVAINKTIPLKVSFKGTAIDHKTFAYTSDITKNIYVSTAKIALLQVISNPISETTYLVGDEANPGELTILNNGVLAMTSVVVKAQGNILVDGKTEFTISNVQPGAKISYPIQIDTSKPGNGLITVTYTGDLVQESIINIIIQPLPPTPLSLTLGRILGYITYALLFLSVLGGAGVYHLKKYISGRKIRILHADLSNLSFTLSVIHAVVLTVPNSPWNESYSWYELIPQSIPNFASNSSLGLELGRWGLVLMYVSVLSGFYIAKIIKRFGRSVGITIHMLSYITLIGGLIHAMLIGGLAKSIIFIAIIMVISILSIGWLKWDAKQQLAKKKKERAEKRKEVATTKTREPAVKPTAPARKEKVIITSSRRNLKDAGILCSSCSTVNDDDAFFCKRCANPLEGIICPSCNVRNTIKAVKCISCSKNLPIGNK